MQRWKLWGCAAALVAAGVLGSAVPGSAQKKGAAKGGGDTTIGYVDLTQVTEQIKETTDWKQNVSKFEAERNKKRNEIEGLAKVRFLNKTEQAELQSLRAKNKPTEAEKSRISELETKSTTLDSEYQKLAMVEKPTDEQTKRLTELTSLREKASGDLQKEYDNRAEDLQKLESDMLDQMQKRILEIVGKVADNKGLTMVVDRQAILYGGQDITKDVLDKLPK